MSESPKSIITKCLSQIATHLPHYKHRPGQQKMMTAVLDAFSRTPFQEDHGNESKSQQGESITVIEGPTGIGKSLGYLLPAIVMAKTLNKKLVVSSATVNLQEQLAYKDVPFLAKYGGLKITYAIAKGRSRYACTYRLKQFAGIKTDAEPSQLEIDALESTASLTEKKLFTQMAKALFTRSWSGDRDSLNHPVADAVWSKITTDRHACLKRSCPDFNGCPFFTARNTLENADLIIANHDLVLADIAMGGGVILPEPANTFYCFDEAHHLADKAIKQFAGSHTINGTIAWLEKIDSVANKAAILLKEDQLVKDISRVAEEVVSYLQDFSRAIADLPALNPGANTKAETAILRFKLGQLPEAFLSMGHTLVVAINSLKNALYAAQNQLKKVKGQNQSLQGGFDRALIDIGFFIGRVANLAATWTLFAREVDTHEPPIAKWITAKWSTQKKQEQIEYAIHASPVSAARLLSTALWQQVAGAVLTSATLRSLGTFDLILAETGLKDYSATTCLALDSPFDFQRQGTLIVPAMKTSPKEPQAHTQELITLLPAFLPASGGNGALVLFSSHQQMQAVTQGLPANLQLLLLIQGQQSRAALLRKHFERINNERPSILVGLASFAEGLDLPGNACNLLIITKLPFAVPDDPVSQSYADWVIQKGGNPFREMTLPTANIKLIQAVGRLIRTETDTGTVVIFDKRLETQWYGKLLYKGLPAFQRLYSAEK